MTSRTAADGGESTASEARTDGATTDGATTDGATAGGAETDGTGSDGAETDSATADGATTSASGPQKPANRRPERERSVVAVAAVATVAALAVALSAVTLPAAVAGFLGLAGVVGGLVRRHDRLVAVGAIALLAGVVLATLGPLSPERAALAVVPAIVAWDASAHLVALRGQLDGHAVVRRGLLAHVLPTAVVTALVAVAAVGAYRFASPDQPTTALVLVLIGVGTLAVLGRH